jgi:methionyl-tRNA synthetase
MTPSRVYLSTTIPYVNSKAHLGHALELVQADVLARHHRRIGDEVRLQSGTDDNALKNVLAAQAAGLSTRELVAVNGRAFAELSGPLALSCDDFIHTSTDPRHRPGAERLWLACAARGDLYRKDYQGLYCVGCEQFYKPAELTDGRCPEHGTAPELVAERNWFFRLSRYGEQLEELIGSGRLRIEPAARRNEVLAFIRAGLEDISVSRSVSRARGWGIPVPGDPGQVIYVWFDALSNYISALGYGTGSDDYRHWWTEADRRIHLVGKGVVRFHAVYWPAMLLSAGEPLPTEIAVHDYLTAGGRKISKSGGAAGLADPVELVGRYGTDAVRWWLLRDVPRVGDADFTAERLVERANQDLANGLGNLVSRVTSLVRSRDQQAAPAQAAVAGPADAAGQAQAANPADVVGQARAASSADVVGQARAPGQAQAARPADVAGLEPPPAAEAAASLGGAIEAAPGVVRAALEDYDFRAGLAAIWAIVDRANRYAELSEPWRLARAARAGDAAAAARRDLALSRLLEACRALAGALAPFVPGLAASIDVACGGSDGVVPPPRPLFPRLAVHQYEFQTEFQAVPPAGEHRTTGPAPGPGSETAAEAARERPLAGVNDSVH